jgi:type IV pilus assembly protein PilQ
MMDMANIRHKIDLLSKILIGSCLFILSCSLMDEGIRKDSKNLKGIEKIGNYIQHLAVSEGSKEMMITIEAEEPILFTQFRQIQPERLIIDVTGGVWGKLEGQINVKNGFVTSIVNTQLDSQSITIARMEVFLEDNVLCELFPKYKKLTLLFTKKETPRGNLALEKSEKVEILSNKEGEEIKPQIENVTVTSEKEPQLSISLKKDIKDEERKEPINLKKEESTLKVEDKNQLKSEDKKEERNLHRGIDAMIFEENNNLLLKSASSANELKIVPAGNIIDFFITKGNGNVQFVLIGDGEFKNFDSFRLMKPDRIVVDIWEIQRAFKNKVLPGDGLYFNRVRFGDYRDKVRVVFDLKKNEPIPYELKRKGNNLIVAFGKDINSRDINSKYKHDLPIGTDYEVSKKIMKSGGGSVINPSSIFQDKPNPFRTLEAKLMRVSHADNSEPLKDPFPKKGGSLIDIPPASSTSQSEQAPSQLSFPKIHTGLEPGKVYTGRRIDLDFQDIDIHNVFRLIGEISNLNIIVDERVKGRITMRLVDIPWDQALDIILQTKDLGMIVEGNVLMIAPLKDLRQKEADIQRAIQAKEKAIAEAEMAKQEAAIKARERQAELEPLITETIFINYSKAKDVEKQFKTYLTKRGTILMDERTNSLTITDVKGTIQTIKSLLERLDTPTPQVMIEARIVQADRSFGRSLGIQWGAQGLWNNPRDNRDIFAAYSGYTTAYQPSTPSVDHYSRWDNLSASQFAVNFPASVLTGLTPAAMGFKFGRIVGDIFSLDLKLSMAEAEGLTRIISRPKITTLDNIKATIKSGESIPYETVSEQGTQTTFVDAVLELTVTPHVTPDGKVKMDIKATKNAIGTFRSATGAPSITKRETETQVLVSNGETTVIGGIFEQTKETTLQAVPWFSKIPILGWLFKGKTWQDKNNELLIFITPFIIKEAPSKSTIS